MGLAKKERLAGAGLSFGFFLTITSVIVHSMALWVLGVPLMVVGLAGSIYYGTKLRPTREMYAVPKGRDEKFDIVLLSAGDNLVRAVRTLSEIYSLSLVQAEELANASLPWMVRPQVSRAEAEYVKTKLEAVGGSVSLVQQR